MDKEIMNKLFLELSQFVEAETEKETSKVRNIMFQMQSWLLEQLLKRCPHNPHDVRADILEGDLNSGNRQLQWCLRCGAYRFATICGPATIRYLDWRRPRPLWCGAKSVPRVQAQLKST